MVVDKWMSLVNAKVANVSLKNNNFDLVRFGLAFIVFLYHVSVLTQLPELLSLGKFLSAELAVDAFFVISGFLIFMSYENSRSIRSYLFKRLRRLAPAYLVVITLSAILLCFASNVEPSQYFSLAWLKYVFVNLITLNFLQHDLPGVFEENYLTAVNGALWTIKVEVMFYLSVPLFVYLFSKMNKWLVMVVIYSIAITYSLVLFYLEQRTGNSLYLVLERQLPGQLAFFIMGALLFYGLEYFKRYLIPILILGLFFIILGKVQGVYFFYPAGLAVFVVYTALFFRHMGNWGKYGDFSFGIYIWHFPITQLFIQLGYFESSPYFALMGLVFTVLFVAFLSWHLVEKVFLKESSHYRKAEGL